jgi:WD40 repeat protein
VWDATTGKVLQTLGDFEDTARALAFSPDGASLALVPGMWDALGKSSGVWDLATGKKRFSLGVTASYRPGVVFSSDGRRIVTNGPSVQAESWLRICQADTGRELLTLKGHEGPIKAFALSPDGNKILSASHLPAGKGTEIRVWDATPLLEERPLIEANH